MTLFFKGPFVGVMLASLAMAACTPTVPDANSGVGFQDYNSYVRGAAPAPGPTGPVYAPPPAAAFNPADAAAALDRADGIGQSPIPAPAIAVDPNAVRPRGGAPAGIKEESGEMVHSNTGISDENDFKAVSGRETIASDKARIERNRADYVVVQPTDLPQRPGNAGPSIVEFALATTHAPGVQLYSRRGASRDSTRACAKFTSPDLAQEEFLRSGGPERDKLGLDPDGDGFACAWDPRPFRTALQ